MATASLLLLVMLAPGALGGCPPPGDRRACWPQQASLHGKLSLLHDRFMRTPVHGGTIVALQDCGGRPLRVRALGLLDSGAATQPVSVGEGFLVGTVAFGDSAGVIVLESSGRVLLSTITLANSGGETAAVLRGTESLGVAPDIRGDICLHGGGVGSVVSWRVDEVTRALVALEEQGPVLPATLSTMSDGSDRDRWEDSAVVRFRRR